MEDLQDFVVEEVQEVGEVPLVMVEVTMEDPELHFLTKKR